MGNSVFPSVLNCVLDLFEMCMMKTFKCIMVVMRKKLTLTNPINRKHAVRVRVLMGGFIQEAEDQEGRTCFKHFLGFAQEGMAMPNRYSE